MDRSQSRRLVRVLMPYLVLWGVLAGVVGALAGREISSSRARALEAAELDLAAVAGLTGEHASLKLQAVAAELATVRILHDRFLMTTPLPVLLAALDGGDPAGVITRFDAAEASAVETTARMDTGAALRPPPAWPSTSTARDGGAGAGSDPGFVRVVQAVRNPGGEAAGTLISSIDPHRLVGAHVSPRFGARALVGLVRGDVVFLGGRGDADADAFAQALGPALKGSAGLTDGQLRVRVGNVPVLVALHGAPSTQLVAFAALGEPQALAGHLAFARDIALLAGGGLVVLTLPLGLAARRAVRDVRHRCDLERRYEKERHRARSDPLTGVGNRIAFDDQLERCNRTLARDGTPFVLAFIDIDRFKALNDSQGHVVGDQALQRIAHTLVASVRSTDAVARLGGDEFAVLMPGASAEGSPRVCGKLHAALLAAAATADLPIGFSIGVVAFEDMPAEPRVITALADRLMYDVKSAGGEGVRYGVFRRDGLHLHGDR